MLSSVIQTRRAKNIFVSVFCIILAVIPADAALYYGSCLLNVSQFHVG